MPFVILASFCVILFLMSVRRIGQNEVGAIVRRGQRTGRLIHNGTRFVIPFIERVERISTENFSVSLPPQSAITKDEIPIQLQASLDAQVVDSALLLKVRDWRVFLMSQLQELMKERMEDLNFDSLESVFPTWVDSIRMELEQQMSALGIRLVRIDISNLSPRTKPA